MGARDFLHAPSEAIKYHSDLSLFNQRESAIACMMDIRSFPLIVTIAVIFLVSYGKADHKCIHDKVKKMHSPSSIQHMSSEDIRQKRQANDYLPFRMASFVVMENVTNSSFNVPRLRNPTGELQSAINYFQTILSVIRAPRNITIPSTCERQDNNGNCISLGLRQCGPYVTVPNEHLTRQICDPICREEDSSINGMNTGGVDTDYIVYITTIHDENCGGGTLAFADYCLLDELTKKPLAGFINICDEGLEIGGNALYYVMIHELLHAIGFGFDNFQAFVDENGEIYSAVTTVISNGERVNAVNSPKVISYGREYYSCSNLPGVLLENDGGSHHWEFRTLGDELMNAVVSTDASYFVSISNFTLSILEDSGWYRVDYAAVGTFYNYEALWGKGLGCSFVTASCDSWQYACSELDEDGCSYDYQAEAYCRITSVSDCQFFGPYRGGYCNLPLVSITRSCFPVIQSGSPNGYCYDRQCYRYSSTRELFYTVETQLCPYDGAELTVLGDTLTCPPADLICSRNTSIILFDSTTDIPPSWCHSSCATCSRPASPAHCLTCNIPMTLSGTAPSVCTADNCGSGTFLDSGTCTACAAGCRACTGPGNLDCLACEDESLYRITINQLSSSNAACVTRAECPAPTITTFGERICPNTNQGGGASSVHYSKLLLAFLLLIYSLYL